MELVYAQTIVGSNHAVPVIFMTCLPSGKADGRNPSMSAFDSYTGLNFFLSQEPNIPSSYKSEFNRIKSKFENSMEHLNLREAVNSKIIFNEILNND